MHGDCDLVVSCIWACRRARGYLRCQTRGYSYSFILAFRTCHSCDRTLQSPVLVVRKQERDLCFPMSIKSLLFYALVHLSSCANTCYYPNGDPSTDEPCDPNALFTQCCGSASNCLSNGLCLVEVNNFVGTETVGTQYARGTCTDKTWVSPLCPQKCLVNQDTARNRSAYNFKAGGVQVWQCTGQGFAAEAQYCCESRAEQQGCCQTKSVVFALQGALRGASTTDTLGQTSTALITSESVSTTASTAIASTTGQTTTPSVASESVLTSAPTAFTSASGKPLDTDQGNTIKIAAGVGSGIGMIILITAIIFIVKRYKLKNHKTGGLSISELPDTTSSKQAIEVWTQPAEMWTQPQELPTEARLYWEMPGHPQTPRQG